MAYARTDDLGSAKCPKTFLSWDGYELKRLSNKIIINFSDRKRKLPFNYFKKLIINNKLEDSIIVLAGILYLEPEEVSEIISSKNIKDEEFKDLYRVLLMHSSSKIRPFSLNK